MSSFRNRKKRPTSGDVMRWSNVSRNSMRSPREANQKRQKPQSLREKKRVNFNDYSKSPLELAREIQNKGNGSGDPRDRVQPKRENHKRPAPVSRSAFSSTRSSESLSHHKRGRSNFNYNKIITADRKDFPEDIAPTATIKRTKSPTVDLCSSDSDTDVDSDKGTTLERSPSSLSLKEQKIKKGLGVTNEHKRNAKLRKRIRQCPGYPSIDMSASSDLTQNQKDDESDSITTQNTTSSLITDKEKKKEANDDDCGGNKNNDKTKKKREKTQDRSEKCPESCFDETEEMISKKNEETFQLEANAGSYIGILKKKPPPDFNKIDIPALKSSFQTTSRRQYLSKEKKIKLPKKQRHYDDVKDMGDGSHMDYDDNDNGNDNDDAKGTVFPDMKMLIDVVKNVNAECIDNKDQIVISSRRTIAAPSPNNNDTSFSITNSIESSCGILGNMKKVNNKGLRAKTKGRKASKIIVPGSSLNQKTNRQQQSEEQSLWLTPNKNALDDEATNWNPYDGGSYRNTRSSTIRLSNENRAYTGRSEVDTESSPRRRCRRKKQKKPETIDILSSDSEDDNVVVAEEDECDVLKFALKRLAVDKRVYNNHDHQPLVIFHTEKPTMEISYFKSKIVRKARERIYIDIADVDEIQYSETDDAVGLNVDLDSFVSFTGDVTMKSMKRRKQEFMKRSQQFVLEFEDDQHMQDIIAAAADFTNISKLASPPDDLEDAAAPLISDSKKKYKLRSRVTPHEIDPFISNRRGDEILVVYPFGMDKNKIEAAADGLKELSWSEASKGEDQDSVEPKNDNLSESSKLSIVHESSENVSTTVQNSQRSHFIEIRAEDYEKLDTGQWLNDSLVDMWMQWISRNVICKQSSNFHFFTSHFYTTLASEGVMGVTSWTAKKNINIFEKRLVFIPINKTLHWSLCVVVNPGAIIPSVDDDDDDDNDNLKNRLLPCMLFFDSLNMHRKARVHKDVVKWLNSEWKRMKDPNQEPFSRNSCKIYDPQVPRQNNGSDCGVFVCRYAFAMFQLRHLKFSHQDAGLDKMGKEQSPSVQRQRGTLRSQVFSDLITNGKEFAFDVDDIQRIRSDFKTLIRNLHPLYQAVKDDKIKAEKEEKKARKRRKGMEKATKKTENATLKSTESVENNIVETHSAMAASNSNEKPGASANDSSDSSKENRIPRVEQEKPPVLKMQTSNDDERLGVYGPLTLEATQQQSLIGAFGMDDQLGQSTRRDSDLSFDMEYVRTSIENKKPKIKSFLKRQKREERVNNVDREEMANNEDMVHL